MWPEWHTTKTICPQSSFLRVNKSPKNAIDLCWRCEIYIKKQIGGKYILLCTWVHCMRHSLQFLRDKLSKVIYCTWLYYEEHYVYIWHTFPNNYDSIWAISIHWLNEVFFGITPEHSVIHMVVNGKSCGAPQAGGYQLLSMLTIHPGPLYLW